MRIDRIDFIVSALATCPLCEKKIIITDEAEHSVDYSELSLELEDAVNDAIAEQAEADGWRDSYCPECREERADIIREQEREDCNGDHQRDEIMDRGAE
tara:strand:+ start:119 stop:415 length:297 start_codon:yes stop_codon:yes gene_type:complete